MNVNDVPAVLGGWNEVETALGALAMARAEQARIEALYNAKVAAINAQKDEALNSVDFQVKQCEGNITGYVLNHLDDFDKKKHKTFNTGKIKVKEAPGYDYPGDKELVALLHHLGLETLIEVKESASKSAIRIAAKSDPGLFEQLEIDVKEDVSITIETF